MERFMNFNQRKVDTIEPAYMKEISFITNETNNTNAIFNNSSTNFKISKNLEEISVPEGIISIKDNAFTKFTSLKKVIIPNSVLTIKYRAFSECTNLISVILPNQLEVISEYLFYKCTSLEEIILPDSVIKIEQGAFINSGLKQIIIPKNTTIIENGNFEYTRPFYGCSQLENIVINKPKNSIPGAPWGATNATITWTG